MMKPIRKPGRRELMNGDADVAAGVSRPTPVWDWPTRLFHWLCAVLVLAAYVTWLLNWMDWHVWIGEAVLALVLFRVLWGLWGSETARFSHFVASPRRVFRHLTHIFRREPDRQIGHNPAGGWMVLCLLALLLGQALTGIFVNNDVADQGPFTDITPAPIANFMTTLHDSLLWNALVAAVVLHVAAIFVYLVFKRQDLASPMITGRKVISGAVSAPRFASLAWALVLFICAAAAAAALGNYM
jgi:cytochrome b